MALQIAIEDPNNGVTATYWRIEQIDIQARLAQARIVLNGYVSLDVRARSGMHVATRDLTAINADFIALASAPASGVLFDAIKSACYAYAKTQPEFATAEDV